MGNDFHNGKSEEPIYISPDIDNHLRIQKPRDRTLHCAGLRGTKGMGP